MKTLPTQVVAAVDRPRVRAVPLVTITLTQPSALSIYLSDRPHWHENQFYEPLLVAEPSSTQGNVDPSTWSFTTGSCRLVVNNARPIFAVERFSDLIHHPHTNPSGHVFEFAACTFHVIFLEETQGNTTTETTNPKVLRFEGRLEAPSEITPDTLELTVSDIILALNQRLQLLIAGLQDLPLLHEDDIGKAANIVYGRAIEVPTLRATPGGRAILLDGLDDDAAIPNGVLRITGCRGFSPSGSFVIGNELLTYGGLVCREDTGEVGGGAVGVDGLQGLWGVDADQFGTGAEDRTAIGNVAGPYWNQDEVAALKSTGWIYRGGDIAGTKLQRSGGGSIYITTSNSVGNPAFTVRLVRFTNLITEVADLEAFGIASLPTEGETLLTVEFPGQAPLNVQTILVGTEITVGSAQFLGLIVSGDMSVGEHQAQVYFSDSGGSAINVVFA